MLHVAIYFDMSTPNRKRQIPLSRGRKNYAYASGGVVTSDDEEDMAMDNVAHQAEAPASKVAAADVAAADVAAADVAAADGAAADIADVVADAGVAGAHAAFNAGGVAAAAAWGRRLPSRRSREGECDPLRYPLQECERGKCPAAEKALVDPSRVNSWGGGCCAVRWSRDMEGLLRATCCNRW